MSKKNKNKKSCPHLIAEKCSIYSMQFPCLYNDTPHSDWRECIRVKYNKHSCLKDLTQEETNTEVWNVDLQEIKQCPHIPKIKAIISENVTGKLFSLLVNHSKTEWLAYLIGVKEVNEENINIEINDIYIPEQEVTSSSVKVLENVNRSDIVGVIHSHSNMNVFHSGTDDEYLIGNHDLSIVTNNKLEFIGKYRYFPKCNSVRNRYFIVDVDVNITSNLDFSSKIKIKENQITYPYLNLKQYTFNSNTDIGF